MKVKREEFALWPKSLLGPVPGLKEINVACWAAFIGLLCAPLAFVKYVKIRQLHLSDFVYFYGIGTILKDFGARRLYDIHAQFATFNRIQPAQGFSWGLSPYPPYVAEFFSILAHLSYRQAYLVWMIVTILAYLYGVLSILRKAFADNATQRSLALCLSLAFSPFIMHTLMNGQLSSVAVFSVGMAYGLEREGKPLSAGLSLSLLVYKPTLSIPMLVFCLVSRRLKLLEGLVAGFVLICSLCTMILGPQVWLDYARFLVGFSHNVGLQGAATIRPWQFVDLHSMLLLLWGANSMTTAIFYAVSAAVGIWLGYLVWTSKDSNEEAKSLAWATVLAWLLLINIYIPYYDASLAVLPMALAIGIAEKLGWSNRARALTILAIAGYAIAWMSEDVAQRFHVQPFGLILIILGLSLGLMLQDAQRQNGMSSSEISADCA